MLLACVEARDAAKHTQMCKRPHNKELSSPRHHSAEAENPEPHRTFQMNPGPRQALHCPGVGRRMSPSLFWKRWHH